MFRLYLLILLVIKSRFAKLNIISLPTKHIAKKMKNKGLSPAGLSPLLALCYLLMYGGYFLPGFALSPSSGAKRFGNVQCWRGRRMAMTTSTMPMAMNGRLSI